MLGKVYDFLINCVCYSHIDHLITLTDDGNIQTALTYIYITQDLFLVIDLDLFQIYLNNVLD
jgi:hypothetical protein